MLHWSIFVPLLIAAAGFGYGLGERNARRSFDQFWQEQVERMAREYRE